MPIAADACLSIETSIGRLWLTATDAGLLAVERATDPLALLVLLDRLGVTASPTRTAEAAQQVDAFLAGGRRNVDLELDLRGVSAFDAAVYAAVRGVRYGETASYREIAAAIGSPAAARAVGNALARCRFSPVVPCHRIIRSDGSIGGWGIDLWVKPLLLNLERLT